MRALVSVRPPILDQEVFSELSNTSLWYEESTRKLSRPDGMLWSYCTPTEKVFSGVYGVMASAGMAVFTRKPVTLSIGEVYSKSSTLAVASTDRPGSRYIVVSSSKP